MSDHSGHDDNAIAPIAGAVASKPTPSPAFSASGWVTAGSVQAVASAQRLVLYAIALYLVAAALRIGTLAGDPASAAVSVVAWVAWLMTLVTLAMGLAGVYRLASALGYAMGVRVLCLILMFLPLVGLATLGVLNSRATAHLRAAGVHVGLLGARR
jgi:hypothetical protein